MSAGSPWRSVATIAVGVVANIYLTPAGAAFVTAMFGLAMNQLFPPKIGGSNTTDPELAPSLTGSGYGNAIPYIIGRARVNTSFIEGNFNTWNPVEVEEEVTQGSGKSKVKGNVSVGYDYRWSWTCLIGSTHEDGLDAVRQVYQAPGELIMLGADSEDSVAYQVAEALGLTLYEEDGVTRVDDDITRGQAWDALDALYLTDPDLADSYSEVCFGYPYEEAVAAPDYLIESLFRNPFLELCYGFKGDVNAGWVDFGESDYIDLYLKTGFENNAEGNCRVYRGSNTQTRVEGDAYSYTGHNYRGTAFATFTDFSQGLNVTNTPSTSFEVSSIPKVPEGSGIYTRGSENYNNPKYRSANAAAAVYQVVVKSQKYADSDIDLESFARASEICLNLGLTLDLVVDSQANTDDLIAEMCSQVGLMVFEDNATVVCKSHFDYDAKYERVRLVTTDQYSDLSLQRITKASAVNEVVASWTDPERFFKSNTFELSDESMIERAGAKVQQSISLKGHLHYDSVQKMTAYNLATQSDPSLFAKFKGTPSLQHLKVGDAIILQISELTNGVVNTPMIITSIDKPSTDSYDYNIEAMADPQGVKSYGTNYFVPQSKSAPWEAANERKHNDVFLADGIIRKEVSTITKRNIAELPPTLGSRGEYLVVAQRPDLNTAGVEVKAYNSSTLVGFKNSIAIGGILSTNLSDTGDSIERIDAFRFTLNDSTQGLELLQSSQIQTGLDGNLAELIDRQKGVVLINNELFHVGYITKLDSGEYQANNVIRGAFGSEKGNHVVNNKVFYLGDLSDKYIYNSPAGSVNGDIIDLDTFPVVNNTTVEIGYPFQLEYTERAIRPFKAELINYSLDGTDLTLNLRPRWYDAGAGISAPDSIQPSLLGLEYGYRKSGAFSLVDAEYNPNTGVATVLIPSITTGDTISIYQVVNNLLSDEISLTL